MFQSKTGNNRTGFIISAAFFILIPLCIFSLAFFTVFFLLQDSTQEQSSQAAWLNPAPRPDPNATMTPQPLVTPLAGSMTTVRNIALGFAIDYPADWRKDERTLQVLFSPSSTALDSDQLPDTAFWVGIPADESHNPDDLLRTSLADFPANVEILSRGTMNIGGQSWQTVQISFAGEGLDGPSKAMIATTDRNRVGYLMVAVASAAQWSSLEPLFQGMFNSFRFTEEAVIRPTDATRPPTPTATPTPVIYIVQSGDNLGAIAVKFGVSVEALAARNNIDDPRYLQTGQKLIIPRRR